MLSYFPRVYYRGDDAERVAGAALAGLLCKQDRSFGPWHSLDDESLGFDLSECFEGSLWNWTPGALFRPGWPGYES